MLIRNRRNSNQILVETTKSGLPAFWECGGACSNTGDAVCVSDKNGFAKKPLFVRTKGHLSNDDHALFVLNKGDVICQVFLSRNEKEIHLYKVEGFEKADFFQQVGINCLDGTRHVANVSEIEMTDTYEKLVSATLRKAKSYHCRSAYFVKE